MMDLREYQQAAYSTCTPQCFSADYLRLGLISEIGELAGKEAKLIRGDDVTDEAIVGELGDIAWFIAVGALYHRENLVELESMKLMPKPILGLLSVTLTKASYCVLWCYLVKICSDYGFTIEAVMKANVEKLASRKKRGVIQGEGDNR